MSEEKSILFTGYYFDGYHGSMMHICEIADYLSKKGFSCYCASVSIQNDIKKYAKSHGLELFSVNDKNLLQRTYDYVWAYHFPILGYLLSKELKYKKIHIGSLSTIAPLESPPIFHKQCALFSVMSEKTKEIFIQNFRLNEEDIYVFKNPLPDNFAEYNIEKNRHPTFPEKIVVISNHVPEELDELQTFLPNSKIDYYGVNSKHYTPITPEILKNYDVVISIGKTVQYALGMGIPIYNYDHFGGSGYITLNNIDKEEYHNFSGRSYYRKISAKEIANEILQGYSNAVKQAPKLKQLAKERYLLSANVDYIMELLDKKENTTLTNDTNYRLFLHYSCAFIDNVLHLYHKIRLLEAASGISTNDFSRVIKYPRWLVKIICCFIPSKKNRKKFKMKHTCR